MADTHSKLIASTALEMMVIGQVINVATGPLGGMLIMSGTESFPLRLALVSIAITLPMAFVVIPI